MRTNRRFVSICSILLIVILLVPTVNVQAKEGTGVYTYTYDFWGIERESPDAYTASSVMNGDQFGIGNFNAPDGLYVIDNMVYICDTGNNRIVQLSYQNDTFSLVRIITEFMNNGQADNLAGPEDCFVDEEGNIFVCDTQHQRILHMNKDLNVVKVITKPEHETIKKDSDFFPQKLVVDSAGRMYVQVQNVNKGFMEFDSTGSFTGYVGASEVSFNPIDYLWKRIATKAQRAQMADFVPTEYNNIALDSEGFVYATISKFDKDDDTKPIRKLNAMGKDILIRNGYSDPVGDLQIGNAGGIKGQSTLIDVVTTEDDTYYALDSKRSRVFAYDFQGNLLYIFGGVGYKEGYFKNPSAIDNIGSDLLILDAELGSLTMMNLTEYGKLINEGLVQYKKAEYEKSADSWKQVLKRNGNYALAYIGIGRALLRQGEYKQAMEYFELEMDFINYSKAYKLYRKEVIEDNIGIIFGVIVGLILIVFVKNRVKKIREEVKEA